MTARAAPRVAAVLLLLGAGDAGAVWYEGDFDSNLALCRPADRPAWCREWFDTIDQVRPRSLDFSLPEWHRLTFQRSLGICSAVDLQPAWCADWLAGMRAVANEAAYQGLAAARKSAVDAVEAERLGRIAAWKALVARVRARAIKPDDVAKLTERADAGEAEALELLAWMHVRGYGVEMNFERAYEFYGRALLAGRADLKANLDKLWPYLNGAERQRMNERFPAAQPAGP